MPYISVLIWIFYVKPHQNVFVYAIQIHFIIKIIMNIIIIIIIHFIIIIIIITL